MILRHRNWGRRWMQWVIAQPCAAHGRFKKNATVTTRWCLALMHRRDFLRSIAGASAAVAFGAGRRARANCHGSTWGEIACNAVWPAGAGPANKLLDIHIAGGMAPWESFYYRPDGGRTRGFDAEVDALLFSDDCPFDPNDPAFTSAAVQQDLQDLSLSSLNAYADPAFRIGGPASAPVHLGPFALPLRLHSAIWNRLRIVVLSHDLSPHEAGIPLAITGKRFGQANFCGLGAPISRATRESTGGGHALPYAYSMISPFAATFPAFGALGAEGGHGGANKPLVLRPGPGFEQFVSRLQRRNVSPSAKDAALAWYRQQYAGWLTGTEGLTRSAAFSDYMAATDGLQAHAALADLFDPNAGSPSPIADSLACTSDTTSFFNGMGITATSLELARYLLTRTEDQSCRYVGMVDEGLEYTGSIMDCYDTHRHGSVGTVVRTSRNIWNLLTALTSIVNDEGEDDPSKINLDETMIVLSTEFGRTPFKSLFDDPNPSSDGRDHWTEGYAIALIGGPIQSRDVVGELTDTLESINPLTTGLAVSDLSPTDVRAACLVGLGINPFEGELYQVGQIAPSLQGANPSTAHEETMINLRSAVLGVEA